MILVFIGILGFVNLIKVNLLYFLRVYDAGLSSAGGFFFSNVT